MRHGIQLCESQYYSIEYLGNEQLFLVTCKFTGANGDSIHFPCSADHEQDWEPYPVDSYMYGHHIYLRVLISRVRLPILLVVS